MSLVSIHSLSLARQEAINGIERLSEELAEVEKVAPDLFWKPLAEMGADDKLRISDSILNFMKEVLRG